ncbi:MAG: F0F1 ATP synthase subunit A [Pseudomonadota bacterium]
MAGPLEQFDIHPVGGTAQLGGFDVSFTNASLWMVITVAAITLFVVGGMRQRALVPGRWQSMVELSYNFVSDIVKENVGKKGNDYFPFIFSLFMFVLMGNLLGLLPYSFTVTSHLAVTFAFAAFIFVGTIIIGLMRHSTHFFSMFLPPKTPVPLIPIIVLIEVISFLSRPVTLSVRLFANMTAGHILLKVFAGFVVSLGAAGGLLSILSVVPLVMNVALTALELIVAVVQAYVFALLTSVYLNDAVNLSH